MCELAIAGKADAARALNERLMSLHSAMFVESNPIPVKWALARMGLIQGGIRLPMTPLSEQYHPQVTTALRDAGLL
jgi:dihydrodipicolinate synthase/N-acetylneuraminate lyase